MPALLDDTLTQGDAEADQELAFNRPTTPAVQPQVQSQVPAPVNVPEAPSVPKNEPPTWQQVQSLPQFQQATDQQKQDAFTKWIGVSHQFSAEQGFNPNDSEKTQISEWTAKQARDLGMASFIDPDSGQSIPINTGMISDYGTRVEKAIGTSTGAMIQGVAHAARYLSPSTWLDALSNLISPSIKPQEMDVTGEAEQIGQNLTQKANTDVLPNPLYDKSAEAKVAGFIGQMLPIIATGPAAVASGAGMMGQQFKNDAADAGLSSADQEEAFVGGAAIGGISQKFAGLLPWLKEAGGPDAIKQALTQTTSATLLKSLAVNSIRGSIEGVGQAAGEQVALHQNPVSSESLNQDLDAGLTMAIGGGLLGTGFKALGVIPAKAAIQSQFEVENQMRADNGQTPISMPDYVAQRIAESQSTNPVPAQGNETPEKPVADPLAQFNDNLKAEVESPTETVDQTVPQKDEVQGTHPVFGPGTYPAHAMLGTMGTTDVAEGTQQLSWNDQPTAQVRRQDTNGNWTYGPATPEEAAMPAFQEPTLTKDALINSKPPTEASINPAEIQAAQAVGPATTQVILDENKESIQEDAGAGAEEQPGQSRPVLDNPAERDDGREPSGDGGREREQDATSPDGEGNNAQAHDGRDAQHEEGNVTEGGGETSALPPALNEGKETIGTDGKTQAEPIPLTSSGKTTGVADGTKAPVEVEAPDELKAKVNASLVKQGVKGVEVVYSKDEAHPAWADPSQPGKVFVNPEAMQSALDKLPDQKSKDAYLDRAVGQEEVFHDAQHAVEADWHAAGTHAKSVDDIYNEIPAEERKKTIVTYGNDRIDPEKGTTPEDVAGRKALFIREHARQILQRKVSGETTEDIWKSGKKPALVRYFTSLYKKLKARVATSSNTQLGAYLRATEGVLSDAKRNKQDGVPSEISASAKPTDQTDTPEFKDWFGDSKVLDSGGKPLIVYHGTSKSGFQEFDYSTGEYGLMGDGFYFTEDPKVASGYANKGARDNDSGKGVYPAFLSIKHPMDMDAKADISAWDKAFSSMDEQPDFTEGMTNEQALREVETTEASSERVDYEAREEIQNGLQKMGYDGITHIGGGRFKTDSASPHRVWIAFDPEQIKSSTGNRGTFNPKDPRITYAPAPPNLPVKSKSKWDAIKDLAISLRKGIPKYDDWTKAKTQLSATLSRNAQNLTRVVEHIQREVPDKARREGISNYIEANGNAEVLRARRDATSDPALKKGYNAALDLTDKEKSVAKGVSDLFALHRQLALKWGIPVNEVENYVPHIWSEDGDGNLKIKGGKSLNSSFRFSKQRTNETYFAGEQKGLIPQTKDISALVGSYVNELGSAIASRQWTDNLTKGKTSDGRPLVAPKFGGLQHVPDTADKKGVVLVMASHASGDYDDYRSDKLPSFLNNWVWKGQVDGKQVLSKESMSISPEIYHEMQNIFGRSAIRDWLDTPSKGPWTSLGKGLIGGAFRLNTIGKTTLFGAIPSLFHPVQIANEAISHRTLTTDIKAPDLSDPAIYDKAAHGLMLAPNEASRGIFMDGLNNNKDNLLLIAAHAIENIPGVDKAAFVKQVANALDKGTQFTQRFIFETFIPSLKNRFYDIVLDRNKARFDAELKSGSVTEDDLKYLTATQANNAFGHLNYVDIARNPTIQHMMQFAFLAPDFFEARLRHTGQALSGVLGNRSGWEQSSALFAMGTAMFITARLVNMALNNGDSKLDQPFSIVNGNRSYRMRTQVGDLYGLVGFPIQNGHLAWGGMFANWRTWVSGRESPMIRFMGEALTGVNYRGEQTTMADAIRDTLAGNLPIPVQGAVKPLTDQLPQGLQDFITPKNSKNNPISPFEQFLGSMGIQISRYSPITQVYPLAKEWIANHGEDVGIKPETATYPTSQYTPLKYALDDGNLAKSWDEYQSLVKANNGNAQKVAKGAVQSINSYFTGKKEGDEAMYESFTPAQKQTYDSAMARRAVLEDRFSEMFKQFQK